MFLSHNKSFLLTVFFLSFVIRALVFICYLGKNEHYWNPDSYAYHSVALEIVKGNGMSNPDGSSHFYRVPGYSLFLAACYKLFGVDKVKALWVQLFLSSLIPVLVFLLSLTIFPNNLLLAKASSLWTVIHLGFIVFSGLLMTETFFIIFFLLFLIFFLPSFSFFFSKSSNYSSQKLFVSGVLLGFASLFRPVGHYLILLCILLLLFSNFFLKKKFLGILMVFIGWLLIIGWILLRNFILTGYLFLHTLPGVHFMNHSAVRLAMMHDGISHEEALSKVTNEYNKLLLGKEKELGRNLLEIECCKVAEQLSINYFLKDFRATLKHFASNMFKTCFSLYSAELLYINSGGDLPKYDLKRSWVEIFKRFLVPNVPSFLKFIIYFEIFLFLVILIVFFIGLFKSIFNLEAFNGMLKALSFIGIFVIASCACGFARLRLPVEPLIIIFFLRTWIKNKV